MLFCYCIFPQYLTYNSFGWHGGFFRLSIFWHARVSSSPQSFVWHCYYKQRKCLPSTHGYIFCTKVWPLCVYIENSSIWLFISNDEAEIQISRYAYLLFWTPIICACDVICYLEREGAVSNLCNWIRFKTTTKQINTYQIPITGHDGILCRLRVF